MKTVLKQYKYEKVQIADKIVELPEVPIYYFETGIRRAIRIVPKWTTWNMETYEKPEFIYEFQITFVYHSMGCKVEKIQIAYTEIERLYYLENDNHDDMIHFIKDWLNGHLLIRSEEQFNNDLSAVINELNS